MRLSQSEVEHMRTLRKLCEIPKCQGVTLGRRLHAKSRGALVYYISSKHPALYDTALFNNKGPQLPLSCLRLTVNSIRDS